MYLKRRKLDTEYERFMVNDMKKDLGSWMTEHKIPAADINEWALYQLDCGDAVIERGRTIQIMQCMKDAYGNPYIPGSSLKGMLRTILLSECVTADAERYQRYKRDVLREANQRSGRMSYLKRETKAIETEAFHTLQRSKTKTDMVNDSLAGLIVSDSKSLSVDALTLCQKIEYHTSGEIKRLNLLRECIKPGTVIDFTITIDSTKCQFRAEDIKRAVADFAKLYYEFFSGKFAQIAKPEKDTVWLGGGAGYVSKTITYPLFGQRGVNMTQTIFEHTGVPRQHKHYIDTRLGVSPHILKMTMYQGKRYQFGECSLRFL